MLFRQQFELCESLTKPWPHQHPIIQWKNCGWTAIDNFPTSWLMKFIRAETVILKEMQTCMIHGSKPSYRAFSKSPIDVLNNKRFFSRCAFWWVFVVGSEENSQCCRFSCASWIAVSYASAGNCRGRKSTTAELSHALVSRLHFNCPSAAIFFIYLYFSKSRLRREREKEKLETTVYGSLAWLRMGLFIFLP